MTSPRLGEAEYLCYQVIQKVRDQYGEDWDLTKTDFNKLCYIADRELREDGFDVELPVHWYRYGGVLTEDAVGGGFYELVEKRWEEHQGEKVTLDEDIEDDDFDVEEDRTEVIEEQADQTVSELGGHYSISVPQDDQYEKYAPNDFVRSLHQFRDFIAGVEEEEGDPLAAEDYVSDVEVSFSDITSTDPESERPSSGASEETNQRIREYLDELIAEYPEDLYSKMEDQFLEWENLSWQMAQNGFYSNLHSFMDAFWKTFSRVELRVKHNRNVPMRIRADWHRRIPEEKREFQNEIENYRDIVLENREETDVLDMVDESYSETVRDMFNQSSANE